VVRHNWAGIGAIVRERAEVLAVIEDKMEAMVRELEPQEREASRALKRSVPREVFADVPF
jgi:hypothetical protein